MPDEKANLKKIDKKSEFKDHIKTISAIIARSHAKSGKISQIMSDFTNKKDLIEQFSKDYTKQVVSDFEEFKKSI